MLLARRILVCFALVVMAILLAGCPRSKEIPPDPSTAPAPAHTVVEGDWVVVADASGHGDKGNLSLKPDGKFIADYSAGGTTEKYSGTYQVKEKETLGGAVLVVELSVLKSGGKSVPPGPPIALNFNDDDQILHDFMTIAYARPGNVEKAKKLYERPASPSEAVAAPVLDSRVLWRSKLPGRDIGHFGLASANVSDSEADEIVTADDEGFQVFDSTGNRTMQAKLKEGADSRLTIGMKDGKPVVVMFGTWSSSASAFDLSGKQLWMFQTGNGIDWLCPVRIDAANSGYGISYNGGGGVEMLGPDGKSKWLAEADWNAWGVTSINLNGKLPEIVVSVGPDDEAIAFDSKGIRFKTFPTGDAGALGSFDVDGDGTAELLSLGTTVSSGLRLTIIDQDGKARWSQKASGTDSAFVDGAPFIVGSFGKRGRLIGVADYGGILFFDLKGNIVGLFKSPKPLSAASVVRRKGKSDLIAIRLVNEVQCVSLDN